MKKSEELALRTRVGDLNTVCGFTEFVYTDGPARGVKALEVYNGRNLRLTVLPDRGLDIHTAQLDGRNVAYTGSVGVRSPHLFQEDGAKGFLNQFFGGLLTTCGITYAGAAGIDQGQSLGAHGIYSNQPARRVSARMVYQGDEAVIEVYGEVRESRLFAENVLLSRTLRLHTERNLVTIHDRLENQGFLTAPVMMIYHINLGFPLLDEGAVLYSGAEDVHPRDADAEKGLAGWNQMEAPEPNRPEECFFHTRYTRETAFAMLHNPAYGWAGIVRFDHSTLPILTQWKCLRAGEYALGLEPTTSGVGNRAAARKDGLLTHLDPGESRDYKVSVEFTQDAALIESLCANKHNQ